MGDKHSVHLEGSVAVVVGACGGIGRAVTARLARAGCTLALVDLSQPDLDTVIRELDLESRAQGYAADVTARWQVDHVADRLSAHVSGVDLLVNAAGINTRQRTLADMSAQEWERVVAVNLNGVFHCVQAMLPLMRPSGGMVINIVSTAAQLVSAGAGTHYCASKRALMSLTASINAEEGRNRVRACAISPGEVATPLLKQRPEPPSRERIEAMLVPEDVAEAVFFVATRPARVTLSELVIFPTSQISGRFVV